MKCIKILLLMSLLTVGLISIAPRAEAANWVWVTSTNFVTVKIDASNCHWVNGTLSFWVSEHYIDSAERNKVISMFQDAAYEDGENVDFSNLRTIVYHLVMYEGKDGTLYYKILYMIWYDNNNYMIDSVDCSPSKFRVLAPDTINQETYKVAKKYAR